MLLIQSSNILIAIITYIDNHLVKKYIFQTEYRIKKNKYRKISLRRNGIVNARTLLISEVCKTPFFLFEFLRYRKPY